MGKTHLANAIGTKIKELYPDKRVLYVSAHLFQVQYTDSVRNNTTNDFINFYQSIDILIIDDIQEFAGVTKTQNTFFHIFNHLHQNGKQLILTSDRAPVLLQGMEERLITRFKWGMVAELERPTVELRKNILRNKIHRDGLQFPPEVIDYIAENVGDSVRDLEGIVISIMAHSTIYNKEIDLELTQRIVRKVVKSESKSITVDDIINVVCKHFSLDTATIHTKSRKREVVQARQIAMFLAKSYTDFSTAKIGALIGHKDHATVLHACKTIKELREVDKTFRAEIDDIQASLKSRVKNPAFYYFPKILRHYFVIFFLITYVRKDLSQGFFVVFKNKLLIFGQRFLIGIQAIYIFRSIIMIRLLMHNSFQRQSIYLCRLLGRPTYRHCCNRKHQFR